MAVGNPSGEKDRVRLLIVDDHPVMGQGLEYFLNLDPGLQVLGTAKDGQAGLEQLRKLNPDVVILDLTMPNLSGQEAIRLYLETNSRIQIVVFSAHQEEKMVHQALQAGVRGYVVKGSSLKDLKQAIHYVRDGGYWISPQFSPGIVAAYLGNENRGLTGTGNFDSLSDREQQVFRLMVAGKETEEIADLLCISGNTVAKHRISLMRKLGLKNVVEMTKLAIRHGLIDA